MGLKAAELLAMYSVDESPLDKSLAGIPGKVAGMAAKLGGGLAIGAALMQSMDNEKVNDKLAAQLGATGKYAGDLGKIAGHLYASNYGDSLGAVDDALKHVLQNGLLPEDATNAQIESITGKVMTLSSAFDVDLGGATNAVAQMIRTGLAKDGSEAMDILTRGFQQGNDKAGDLLDTFNEYGTQFRKLGIDGTTAMGLISQGLKGGARDSDLVADAIKEFSIRAVDGSTTTAAGFKSIGLNAQDMAEKIGKGGPTASAALALTLDKLREIKDPALQAQAAVGLFGTQAEDMGQALYALHPETAVKAMGDVAGAVDKVGKTMNDNASTRIESFKRAAITTFVNILGNQVLPVITSIVGVLVTAFGPAVTLVGGFLSDTLIPALKATVQWIDAHRTPVLIVAGIIAAVFLPHLIALAAQAVLTGATTAAMWVASQIGAIQAAAVHSVQIVKMIGSWVLLGAQAIIQGVKVAAVWTAQIVASAVTGAVSFGVQVAKVVAGWVLMGAQAVIQGVKVAAVWTAQVVASAVSGAVSFGVQVARVVAGWVLMGAQSLIQAARMAAAWFIALGPVGWVIAAVIGLVALIVANWDTVVSWTKTAWNAVTGALSAAWEWIKGIVSGAVSAVTGAISAAWNWVTSATSSAWNAMVGAVSSGVSNVISFVQSIPGRILGALGNLGSLLLNAGKNLLEGLWNGISGATSWLLGKVGAFFGNLLPGWVRSMLGIKSPSTVFAEMGRFLMLGMAGGIDSETKTAVTAAERAAAAITGAMAITAPDLSAIGNAQAMAGLTARRPTGAASSTAAGSSAAVGGGPLLNIEGDYVAHNDTTPAQNAQALATEIRTRPWT